MMMGGGEVLSVAYKLHATAKGGNVNGDVKEEDDNSNDDITHEELLFQIFMQTNIYFVIE